MSRHDLDFTEDVKEDEEQDDSDSVPIIILPDELEMEGEGEEEPEPEPAAEAPEPEPEPPATPPPKPVPQPVKAPAVQKPVLRTRPRSQPPTRTVKGPAGPEPEPVLSIEELETQIDDELTLDQAGQRQIFSMPRFCKIAGVVTVLLLALLLKVGWDYYRQPLVLRPLHHFHTLLRPSGVLGLSLGILGALTMLSSMAYLVRKALVSRERQITLQGWMGFHILMGLLGPAIAFFHGAFVPTSALGLLALASAAIVVASGMVGRYIAVYFPHSLEGREFKFEEVRGRLTVYQKKLTELGVDPAILGIDAPRKRAQTAWLVPAVIRVICGDWESRREFRRLREILYSKGELRIQTEMILFLIRRLCWERQWLVRYGEFRKFVGAWRFVHRWLAIVLLMAVAFHVVIAAKFGGLWILGGGR